MIKRLASNVWKIAADSNVYFLDLGRKNKVVIDTGRRESESREKIRKALETITRLEDIRTVIFTHLHYDHIGNYDLFRNASFYASKEEIRAFKLNPIGATLDPKIGLWFKAKLKPIKTIAGLKVIDVPGHTKGSITLWYAKEKMLFTGDTVFFKGTGRVDLPSSSPEEIHNSIEKLKKFNYAVLCPGHDY